MTTREHVARQALIRELRLVSPPNWTGVGFLCVLSGLHFSIAIPAFLHQRWEGYLSLIFACIFAIAALVIYCMRYELTIDAAQRRIRLRTGLRSLAYERAIPFADVHAVRLTHGRRGDARIEVLCDNEDIECPPTSIPRQEALFLAITMQVELIKVSNEPSAGQSDRLL